MAAQKITLYAMKYTQNKGLNSYSEHYGNKPLHIQSRAYHKVSRDFKKSRVSSRKGSTA